MSSKDLRLLVDLMPFDISALPGVLEHILATTSRFTPSHASLLGAMLQTLECFSTVIEHRSEQVIAVTEVAAEIDVHADGATGEGVSSSGSNAETLSTSVDEEELILHETMSLQAAKKGESTIFPSCAITPVLDHS